MFNKKYGIILILFFLLSGCGQASSEDELQKVGLLVPDTIDDQVWGTKGYKGLLKIQSELNVDVFYKEGMNSETAVREAVAEFAEKGVNLIFGHGNEYQTFFRDLQEEYPDIHFVFFNGDAKGDNVTSLSFNSHAMGFFAGMVAAHMSKTKEIGIIAAFEWQPEVEGFYQGAKFEDNNVNVKIQYIQSWNDTNLALQHLDELIAENVDVVYPAGDGYNVPVIEHLKEHGLYAIGYVSDQADLGEQTVLTSTVQHVDRLYVLVAKRFQNGELESGNLYFDFQDDVINMGKFSSLIDDQYLAKMHSMIETYRQTGKLPNEE
ncbi:BMP family ABC transporter substrate-binding protein [Bacillus sp. FJAT-47783]|uniref:BMP family ABC transporter substrate-binding protein n=1 Tax=Bacillus sp. FJAT-47783 TaxID=2922712 RepID=UPI001FAC6B10|nr:BMP family ABC transporter substrate-binding protein [Bacillus sp. FJAT-47783]